ncbi:MAG: DUF2142 domain-containing protein [Marmoricola sp.]
MALQLAWILAVIPYFGIDEFDHAFRASSVADGHWHATHRLPPEGTGRGDLIRVREDVARSAEPACNYRPYTGLYNCYPKSNPSGKEVVISSGAARYNPTFYWVVGSIAKPFHGNAALYAMRIASAMLCTLVFVLAVWLLTGLSRSIWPTTAGLLAALPTTVYSSTVAAPNGLNMMAGLAVWASLLALREEPIRRAGYVGLAVSSAVLLNTHTLGTVWFGLILVTVALLTGPRQLVRTLVPRGRTEIVALVMALAAAAFDIWWILTSGVNDPGQERSTFHGAPWSFIAQGLVLWPFQAMGAFPMRNDNAPLALYATATVALVLVSALAIQRIRLRSRTTAALLFVAGTSFLVPAYLTAATFHQIGAAWQGRYQVPFSIGLIVMIGSILDRSARPVRFGLMTASLAVAAMAMIQPIGQLNVVGDERGYDSLVAATGWSAPSAVLLLSIGLLAAVCWVASVRSSRGLESAEGEPGGNG